MTTPEEPTQLSSVGERYVLVDLVAADEHREVWRAHDDIASRSVVLTRWLGVTEEWRRAFDRRARALEALSSPGIASTLRHDAHDDPPWVAAAWIEGDTAADIEAESGFTTDDALATIGQAAIALAAAHDGGVAHGRLDPEHVVVRGDGSVALIGFVTDSSPSAADDLPALVRLADTLLDSDAAARDSGSDAAVEEFRDWLAGRGTEPANDLGEIGRTALALATTHRASTQPTAAGPPAVREGRRPTLEPARPWYDEAERKRVRNRLIALGAIVVIGGGALLRIFASGAGQETVPNVIGLPWPQAQHNLNEIGFRASESVQIGTSSTDGTVVAQNPPGGTRAKIGTEVDVTVAEAGG